jgi:hypothetical protein
MRVWAKNSREAHKNFFTQSMSNLIKFDNLFVVLDVRENMSLLKSKKIFLSKKPYPWFFPEN